uniref:GATA-type domain-containing protein n=1 Tax=Timema tahoe TaxID=61484 RepID=A0A7R9IUJ7_9NEOP|nr:unnamed protein product [Timema tahoe]
MMKLGFKPVCVKCQVKECFMWRKVKNGIGVICNECFKAEENAIKIAQDSKPKPIALPSPSTGLTPLEMKVVSRRKAPPRRSKRLKQSTFATSKEFNPKGRGQRVVGVEKKTFKGY